MSNVQQCPVIGVLLAVCVSVSCVAHVCLHSGLFFQNCCDPALVCIVLMGVCYLKLHNHSIVVKVECNIALETLHTLIDSVS